MFKICPYSGEKFVPKRKNQIYATSKNRRSFHNLNAAEVRYLKLPIDRVLNKNFQILSELVEEGDSRTFLKEELMIKGFNPNFFTHLDIYDGKKCRCIYHFILPHSVDNNSITVIFPDDRPDNI